MPLSHWVWQYQSSNLTHSFFFFYANSASTGHGHVATQNVVQLRGQVSTEAFGTGEIVIYWLGSEIQFSK